MTNLVPIVVVPNQPTVSFFVPAADTNGDTLRWRLATTIETGGTGPPPGFTINFMTGQVTWNTSGLNTTNPWTAQVIIEDLDGSGNVKSYVPVDFLLVFGTQPGGQAPTCAIAPPGPFTVGTGTPVTFTVTGTDPDAGNTVTLNVSGLPVGATMTPVLPTSGPGTPGVSSVFNWTPAVTGSFPIVYSVTDNTGQQGLCNVTVIACPPLVCPANIITSTAPGQCAAVVNYTAPTTTAGCGPVTCTPPSGAMFNLGVTTVTCNAAGGGASCSFTVTVNDTQAPTIACPTNITTTTAVGQCAANVSFTPTATDNCTASPTITCTPSSGSSFPVGTTTVTCKATDAAGNMSPNCSFTVTVNDTQAPTLGACPTNITTTATTGQCAANVSFTAPTATDNCTASPTVTCTPASGSSFPVGTTTVTCRAVDAAGNQSQSCSFTVTVNDTQAPTVVCPGNQTASAAPNTCAANVTFSATAQDNCPGATVTCTPASGASFPVGTTTVTCRATDAAGNQSSTCSFTVTVNDTQAPVLGACPANIAQTIPGLSTMVNYTPPTATDNCPGASVACTPPSGSTFNVGTTTVTCKATDAAGNMSASCSFTVMLTNFVPDPKQQLNPSDPLACIGPGSLIEGSFGVTNTTSLSQTGTLTKALAAQLVPIAGSCAANVGACTITGQTVQWTGTLAPSQTLNVSYRAQIADSTLSGTQACAVTTASFPPGNPVSIQGCVTVNCPLVGPGSPHDSRAPVSDQKPGSILFYNIFTSDAASGNLQNTRISLTNTHPSRPAFVHLFFVDGSTCGVADSYICLTAQQTASFLASDIDPGTSGYVVAVAVDASGCPINFNYLIGDEFVKFSSGHAANLGAESITAIAGGLPACNPNTSVTAPLAFDGVSYNVLPRVLALSNIPSRADGNDTLLIVNRVGGNLGTGAATLGGLFGIIYDDAENAFSFNIAASTCQTRTILNNNLRIVPRFETIIPSGRSGWLKISTAGEAGILGAMINRNPNATTSANAFNQGHNLHKLTLINTMVYTIPVFPPSC